MNEQQIEEAERLLSYYEGHVEQAVAEVGGRVLPFWVEDTVKFLRDLLPEWSAFRDDEQDGVPHQYTHLTVAHDADGNTFTRL
jgi:hypothetical protein